MLIVMNSTTVTTDVMAEKANAIFRTDMKGIVVSNGL